MPGFENKIWGMKYDEPYSTTCYEKVCAFGSCTKIPYPCFGMKTKKYEILIGFKYPSVTPQQQAIIYECATIATEVAANIIAAAAATCVALNAACIKIVAAAIAIANETAKATFRECLIKARIPNDIISKCKIGVYERKLDA